MTNFTADQLRSIITLSQNRYHENRAHFGLEAASTRRMAELNKTATIMLQEMTAEARYSYINTGRVVQLGDLTMTDDINDQTVIEIYGCNGNFLARGNWYQDDVLEWTEAMGIAKKSGTGHTVSFRIMEPGGLSGRISLDNGKTFLSPVEALSFVSLDLLTEYMVDDIREAVHADLAPCSDVVFLTAYLKKSKTDLIIG